MTLSHRISSSGWAQLNLHDEGVTSVRGLMKKACALGGMHFIVI
jgi:hypothetical protein